MKLFQAHDPDGFWWIFLNHIDMSWKMIYTTLSTTHCVTSLFLSIIQNGSKISSFKPSHGLRQGNQALHYLFIISIKKLFVFILDNVRNGSWKPIFISPNEPHQSRLLLANVILLLSRDKSSQIMSIDNLFIILSMSDVLRLILTSLKHFSPQASYKPKFTNLLVPQNSQHNHPRQIVGFSYP